MNLPQLKFERLWTSSADFPTLEESEIKVREDFQYHPDAIKDYINTVLLPEMERMDTAIKDNAGELDALTVYSGETEDVT